MEQRVRTLLNLKFQVVLSVRCAFQLLWRCFFGYTFRYVLFPASPTAFLNPYSNAAASEAATVMPNGEVIARSRACVSRN